MESGCEFILTKQKLIEDNINLVYALVSREYPAHLYDEDIIQCGMLGLCKAANKWDETKGSFSNLAWISIRNEICREFKKRAKHQGVLSLDYEMVTDGARGCLQDILVGDEDVAFVDVEVKSCRLNDTERKIYAYLVDGLSPMEITKKMGLSKQFVYATRRKLKALRNIADRKEY